MNDVPECLTAGPELVGLVGGHVVILSPKSRPSPRGWLGEAGHESATCNPEALRHSLLLGNSSKETLCACRDYSHFLLLT